MKTLPRRKSILLSILSTILLLIFTHACTTVPLEPVPTDGWSVSTPEDQGMQSKILADMMDDIEARSLHVDSVTIVRNGHVVLDAYVWPATRQLKHNIYSCTKSVMSALIGIAIDKGYIEGVHQPITDFFEDDVADGMDGLKKTITLEHLLTMTSGLDCRDSYRHGWAGLHAMMSSANWAQYMLDLPMAATPGEKFEYCNGVSYLLSVIVQNTTGMRTLDFARQHLFEPLGIKEIVWEQSPQGVDVGYGDMRLKPSDMAKFGWLYLKKGRWGEQQIIPAEWVEASTRGHIDVELFDHYGYQWWGDSQGFYMAVGYKGQRIFVVPEKNLVAVFTANLTGANALAAQKLLNLYVIPAASSAEPLPAAPREHARMESLVSRLLVEPTDMVWISEDQGMARNGIFTRSASPAFRFEYPIGSKKTNTVHRAEIMRMKAMGGYEFSAGITMLPSGMPLEAFGPELYAKELKRYGSDIEMLSNVKTRLKCGTTAYRTDFKWKFRGREPVTTLVVSAEKSGVVVFVNAHPTRNPLYAERIVQSLTLD